MRVHLIDGTETTQTDEQLDSFLDYSISTIGIEKTKDSVASYTSFQIGEAEDKANSVDNSSYHMAPIAKERTSVDVKVNAHKESKTKQGIRDFVKDMDKASIKNFILKQDY